MIRKQLALVLTLILAGLMATSPAFAKRKKAQNTAATTAPATNTVPATTNPNYVISPGDVLDINVWKEPDVSTKALPVRPDGKVSIPLLNDVQAAGETALQLAANITTGLKKFISNPQVTVVVVGVNSQRYYVLGEVLHGGVFPLLPGMTALQAISAAGGFSPFANPKKMYILRTVNGKQEKLPFNYKAVMKGENMNENVQLIPGDTIVVP